MTMITPSYLGETIEYSSLHACRSTLEDPTSNHLNDIKSCSNTPLFIAALFSIVKTWKKPKCPTTDDWIKKMSMPPFHRRQKCVL